MESTNQIIEHMNHLQDCADHQGLRDGFRDAAEHFAELQKQIQKLEKEQAHWQQVSAEHEQTILQMNARFERLREAGITLCELAPASPSLNVAKQEFHNISSEEPRTSFQLVSEQEQRQAIHGALWEFHNSYDWNAGDESLYFAAQNLRSFADKYAERPKNEQS